MVMLTHYLILALYLLTVLLLVFILYLLSCVFFASGIDEELQIEKFYGYECGFAPFSDARDAFDIKFYLVAVLFLIFDLEIAFLLPLCVGITVLSFLEVLVISLFLVVLSVGFIYEWKKGGLDW